MLQNRTKNADIIFSVIIPIYNKREYVERAVKSVLDSTFKSVEIICIDDGSTDESISCVPNADNIVLVCNEQNKGVAYSRNKGIDLAKGEYIVFLDADDYLDSNALELYYKYLQKFDGDGCLIKIINNHKTVNIKNKYERIYSGKELLKELVINNEQFLYACGAVWRLDYIKKNKIRFRNLKIGEGGLFLLEALLNAEKIGVAENEGYIYCINESSTCNMNDSLQISAVGQIKQLVYMISQLTYGGDNDSIVTFLDWYLRQNMGGISNLNEENICDLYTKSNTEEMFLAKLLLGEYLHERIKLSAPEEALIKEKGHVNIYGAGYETLNVLKLCNRYGIVVDGIYVSEIKGNPSSIYGFVVNEFDKNLIADKSIPFLISAHKKHHVMLEKLLLDSGIEKIIKLGE